MIKSLFLVVIAYIPGVLLQYYDLIPVPYPVEPLDKSPYKRGPFDRDRHRPPSFSHEYDEYEESPFDHRPGGYHDHPEFDHRPAGHHHGHDFDHEHSGEHGHGGHHGSHGHRGHGHRRHPPFGHKHGHGHRKRPHFDSSSSSEEDYDYEDFTTKKSAQSSTAKPSRTTKKSTTTTKSTATTKSPTTSTTTTTKTTKSPTTSTTKKSTTTSTTTKSTTTSTTTKSTTTSTTKKPTTTSTTTTSTTKKPTTTSTTTKSPTTTTTKKSTTTSKTTKSSTTSSTAKTASTTTNYDYAGEIDIRFGIERTKRSTKSSNPSTTEILNKFNTLGHHPDWNTPGPNFKPNFFYPSLTTCTEKTSECLPAYQCKILKRNSNFGPDSGFCKWEFDEPYVCCEKSKEKFQNLEFDCGARKTTNGQSEAIIGGVNANGDASYPWMVAIGENLNNRTIDWYCGGALISKRTVVTAAHCVSKRNADLIRIGEIDLAIRRGNSSNLQEIKISETKIHPLYRSPLLYNDVALLYLDKPVELTTFARPICLPEKTSISKTPIALLTGWGQLSFASQRSAILQQVTVKLFNNTYCDQQYSITQASRRSFPKGILDTQICAGDERGGKDACQGDSGSPLVTEENGSFVLIGVVSAGIGCGSKIFPGIYTRISSFTPWIIGNIK